jgi:hypothetical protein
MRILDAVAALAVLLALDAAWRDRTHTLDRSMPPRRSWPVMIVAQGADARTTEDALAGAGISLPPAGAGEEAEGARAFALALSALTPVELEGLRRALEDLEERLAVRANPLVEELDDGDPMERLARLMPRFLPTLTASNALASGPRVAPEGRLATAIAMRCDAKPADPDVRCIPLWGAPQPADRVVQRGRFFEWPLAAAAVLGFADADGARGARDALRIRAREDASRISLVLTGDDLAGRGSAAVAAVREQARRVLAIARRDPSVDTRLLEHLANEPPAGARPVPRLELDPEEVLVVPKLGALVQLEAFVQEVERDVSALGPAGTVEWVYRPEPIR